MIACLQLPQFAIAVERRSDPTLEHGPLVLSRKETVYAASREALRAGVQPGMALRPARALCAGGIIREARPALYEQLFSPLTSLLAAFAPAVEPEEVFQRATCYLDLGTVSRTDAVEVATEMGRAVRRESQLEPCVGIAQGKFPARIAAHLVRPNRARFVPAGQEGRLLAPLPLETLPLDAEMARRLRLLGIRTVGEFAALPRGAILTQFGWSGQQLHRLAQGQDERPVRPRLSRPSEEVLHTFDDSVPDRFTLEAVLYHLAATLASRLQPRFLGAKTLWLVVTSEQHARYERRRMVHEPLASAEGLDRVLKGLLKQVSVPCGVVSLQVLATDLVPLASAAYQLDLFDDHSRQTRRFRKALPHLVQRYGADRFYSVVEDDLHARVPGQQFRFREWGAT